MRTFTRLVAVALALKIEETNRHLQRIEAGTESKNRKINIAWPISCRQNDSVNLKPELFPISADDFLGLYAAKVRSILTALEEAHTALCDNNAEYLNESFGLGAEEAAMADSE